MFIALAYTKILIFIAVAYALWLLMGEMQIGFNCRFIADIMTER